MRRRSGFTLVEMLVSVALVLFIMVILTEAFGKGLESFRTLKAIGDMESRLRSAVAVLRRDLAMDHFEGKRRLSDDRATWNLAGKPREGRFDILPWPGGGRRPEGSDADGILSQRASDTLLHFTAKARGNDRSEFFTANVPRKLLRYQTTFFNDLPPDARFQEQPTNGIRSLYSSQWMEVAYFLLPTQPPEFAADGITPLHTLYRVQMVMVADNTALNWGVAPVPGVPPVPGLPPYWEGDAQSVPAARTDSAELSCLPVPSQGQRWRLHFCTPGDLAQNDLERGANYQGFDARSPLLAATPLLTQVVSFDVSWFTAGQNSMAEGNLSNPGPVTSRLRVHPINALKVVLRVYDQKTKLTRQMTVMQDL